MALTEQQTSAIIGGASDTLGGVFNVLGKKQDVKAGQYASQAEVLKAISEQKKAEAEAKTKKYLIIGGVVIVVVVLIVVSIIFMNKKRANKQKK